MKFFAKHLSTGQHLFTSSVAVLESVFIFVVPVVVIVTKFDVLIQDSMSDEDIDGPNPYGKATDIALQNFEEHYRKPLMNMPAPPDFVIKLSEGKPLSQSSIVRGLTVLCTVHKADPNNSILGPLVDATLSSLKNANTDILMSLATAKRLTELIPLDFPL